MGEPAKKDPGAGLTLEELELLEDEDDIRAAREAIAEMEKSGQSPIPSDEVKRRLGL